MREHFFRRMFQGTLALLIWGAHFALSYGLVAAQCSPGGYFPGAPTRMPLAIATIVALAACAALGWRALRAVRAAGEEAALLDWARAGGALLAMAGITWTGVPLLLVDGCA